jgi:hypothetical protein
MKEIKLHSGNITIVDDEDYERFSSAKCYETKKGYAYTNKGGFRYLHRDILDAHKGVYVDHINGKCSDPSALCGMSSRWVFDFLRLLSVTPTVPGVVPIASAISATDAPVSASTSTRPFTLNFDADARCMRATSRRLVIRCCTNRSSRLTPRRSLISVTSSAFPPAAGARSSLVYRPSSRSRGRLPSVIPAPRHHRRKVSRVL